MTRQIHRRDFLGRVVATGALASGVLSAGVHSSVARAESRSPNEKLRLACIGVSNKGGHNIAQLTSEEIVAICDVDSNFLGRSAQQFPKAAQFRDFRKLLETAEGIDAVVVSTADHTHAPATVRALRRGLHVYCEKPLTHTVHEARIVAELAAKHKCVTQMGTQVHASENYRRVVEAIQAGAIGPVREVYTWCNKGWADGRFQAWDKPVPANLDWDLWLGPAKERPYSPNLHPANWRRFWEYGTGTFGDMACHIVDLPFWALKLRHPTTVAATGPEVHPDGAPSWCLAEYDFPARGDMPALKLFWANGDRHHERVEQTLDDKGKSLAGWGLGSLFVGDNGMLAADYGRLLLLPQDRFKEYEKPSPTIPPSIGHWKEWVTACKTGGPTSCNFDYSGALTETVLLGVAAYRSGQKLQWDGAKLAATNTSEADRFLKKEYRAGWEVA